MATIGGRGVADVSYVPGALTAVVGDQCWALVEAAPDSPAVARIWQQLGQGAAADVLLVGLLTDGPPGGIPGFTLLVAGSGGQHRLFCRGAVGATVVAAPADGGDPRAGEGRVTPARIDGTGLLTWRERVVDNMTRIFLGEPPADTALRLPATSGVLLAGCVIIDLTNAAARDTGSPALDRTKKNIVLYPDTITMAGGPGRPDVPGSGAFPASADGRPAQDDEHDFRWGGLSRTVVDGGIGQVQYPGAPPARPAALAAGARGDLAGRAAGRPAADRTHAAAGADAHPSARPPWRRDAPARHVPWPARRPDRRAAVAVSSWRPGAGRRGTSWPRPRPRRAVVPAPRAASRVRARRVRVHG
jgi:hypothetical protein